MRYTKAERGGDVMAEAHTLFEEAQMGLWSNKKRTDFNPEEINLFQDLHDNINDLTLETFIPLVLTNREKAIFHVKRIKDDIDKLLQTL